MRNSDGSINYLLGDHLGSVSTVVDASGQIVSQSRYLPFGEVLWEDGSSPTDYTYTGQRSLSDIGLMDYNARFYDPMLGRFTSPDSIVPDPGSVIGYNRYAYVNNNPMIYTDPSGHFSEKQLERWFGTDWKQNMTNGWQITLLNAEYGDALVVDNQIIILVGTGPGGGLTGWNISDTITNRSEIDITQHFQSKDILLYRSISANLEGGPTPVNGNPINIESVPLTRIGYNSSTPYQLIFGDVNSNYQMILPDDWQVGSTSHIQTSTVCWYSPNFGDVVGLLEQGAAATLAKKAGSTIYHSVGGTLGLMSMIYNLTLDDSVCDTNYWIEGAPGNMSPLIIPMPSIPSSSTPTPPTTSFSMNYYMHI